MVSLVFLVTTFVFMTFSTFYLIFSIGLIKLRYFLLIWFLVFIIAAIIVVFFIFKISKQKKRFEKLLRWIYKFSLCKFIRKNFKSSDKFVQQVRSKQKAFLGTIKYLWVDKKAIWVIFTVGFFWYLLQGFGLWLLFKGLGFSVPYFRLVAVMTISLSIGYLVFVPGGTGATEGAAVLIMSLLGVPASAIAAVILVDRFTYYLMGYGFGYLAISYLSMVYTTPGKMIKNFGK
jgi:uncharacterized protein (TIRG00374 family)